MPLIEYKHNKFSQLATQLYALCNPHSNHTIQYSHRIAYVLPVRYQNFSTLHRLCQNLLIITGCLNSAFLTGYPNLLFFLSQLSTCTPVGHPNLLILIAIDHPNLSIVIGSYSNLVFFTGYPNLLFFPDNNLQVIQICYSVHWSSKFVNPHR